VLHKPGKKTSAKITTSVIFSQFYLSVKNGAGFTRLRFYFAHLSRVTRFNPCQYGLSEKIDWATRSWWNVRASIKKDAAALQSRSILFYLNKHPLV